MRVKPAVIFSWIGWVLIVVAVCAEILRLDNDSGWGQGRILLLVFGILSVGISYYFSSQTGKGQNVLYREREVQQHYWLVIPSVVAMILFYIWFMSSGRWTNWKSPTHYYADLAEAFSKGNLYLALQPDPKLLDLENPYDPLERAQIDVPADLSLYNGRFYMYWGPVPALFLMTVRFFFDVQIGDMLLTLIFACGILVIQSLVLLKIWDCCFRALPKWTLHIAMFLAGLTGPITLLRHNYDHARIYEASIAGGQFFLLGGLFMAFTAILNPSISDWKLAGAGALWTLAIGTRQALAIPIGFMLILTAWFILQANIDSVARIRKYISLVLPLTLGFAGWSWYNWARFGSIMQNGLYYALAGSDIQGHYTDLFSRSYLIQNLYNYLFNPLELSSKFPFVFMLKGSEKPVASFYAVPEFYNAQPIVGLIYIFPFVIFARPFVIDLFFHLFKRRKDEIFSTDQESKLLAWISLNLGGSFLISFFLLMAYFWAGMRFFGDFITELTILCSIGFWQGWRSLQHKPLAKTLYSFSGVILAGVSIVISILVAISTNSRLVNLIVRNFHSLR